MPTKTNPNFTIHSFAHKTQNQALCKAFHWYIFYQMCSFFKFHDVCKGKKEAILPMAVVVETGELVSNFLCHLLFLF